MTDFSEGKGELKSGKISVAGDGSTTFTFTFDIQDASYQSRMGGYDYLTIKISSRAPAMVVELMKQVCKTLNRHSFDAVSGTPVQVRFERKRGNMEILAFALNPPPWLGSIGPSEWFTVKHFEERCSSVEQN